MELKVKGLSGRCLCSPSFACLLDFNYHQFQPSASQLKMMYGFYVEISAGSQEAHIHQADSQPI